MLDQPQDRTSQPYDPQVLETLIDLALGEDLDGRGDITTRCANVQGRVEARIEARAGGIFAGAAVMPRLLEKAAPKVRLDGDSLPADGQPIAAGQTIARLTGPIEQILAAERTVLNILQRLCGVATLTSRFVEAVAGTSAKIYDTRKTMPGWRSLDKYAVRCGGGSNHRFGLYDAVLVKDNHLAGVSLEQVGPFLRGLVERARRLDPPIKYIEVEVDDLAFLEKVLAVDDIDAIMLDNFTPQQLRQAVQMRNEAGLQGKVALEASGNITLANVRRYAETGIDLISTGAITHSARGLDLALEIDRP